MYLATTSHNGSLTYQIRRSRLDQEHGCFRPQLVFDLGENPADHIEVMDEVTVWFSSEIEEAVAEYTREDTGPLLEGLLHGFLPRNTRDHLARFSRSKRKIPTPLTEQEQAEIASQIHLFDRRRLYYLHYRAVDQSRLFHLRERACRPLLNQSRDEREYHFIDRERSLKPGEYQKYLFAIFNLQSFFNQHFARWLPEALPQIEVADHFVEALCELNRTSSFWKGEAMTENLHPHLRRYVVMFFDFIPERPSFQREYVHRFINSHRTFRWPERKPAASEQRISELFGRSLAELKKMGKRELNRLYRQKALKLHPDHGGHQEGFVELTEVYTLLRSRK